MGKTVEQQRNNWIVSSESGETYKKNLYDCTFRIQNTSVRRLVYDNRIFRGSLFRDRPNEYVFDWEINVRLKSF